MYHPTLIQEFRKLVLKQNRYLADHLTSIIALELRYLECNSMRREAEIIIDVVEDWVKKTARSKRSDVVTKVHITMLQDALKRIRPFELEKYSKYWLQDMNDHFIPLAVYIHEVN